MDLYLSIYKMVRSDSKSGEKIINDLLFHVINK